MKQGYLGEVVMSRSARLLRFLIYLYIIVGVIMVIIRKRGFFSPLFKSYRKILSL